MAGTIVYVDMAPDLPEGLGLALGRLGFRLQFTPDLDEAFTRVRDGAARLVIVEVLLDDGHGWHLIPRIRGLEGAPGRVPIVILTRAERTARLHARAVELGADDLRARPVTRAQMLRTILGCVGADAAGEPADRVLADPTRGVAREASGSLEELPVPELLMRLRSDGATGLLFLQDFEELTVQLRGGALVAVASSRGDETFADFLMRTKRISDEEHEALLERAHAAGESEPAAAVSIRAMSRREVQAALADRAAEPLLEAFMWTAGSWRFEPGRRLDSGRAIERGVARMLVQGVLQWTPSRAVRAMLDRRGALYLSRVDRPVYELAELSPLPCEPDLLDRWVGDDTVAEVLESGVVGERELYALLVTGVVETHERSPLELQQVVEPDALDDDESSSLLEIDDLCEPVTPRERVAPAPRRAAAAPRRIPVRPARPRPPAPRAAGPPAAPRPQPPRPQPRDRPGRQTPSGLLARLRSWWVRWRS